MVKTLTDKQRKIINIIKAKGSINRRELSRILNVSYQSVRSFMKRLQKFGVINSVLQGRERYYSIDERRYAILVMKSPPEVVRRHIERHPGVYFKELSRELHISTGTLSRILAKLEKEEKVISTFDGHIKRFYPEGMAIEEVPMPLSPAQKRVVEVIARNPGTTHKEVALDLDLGWRMIYYHVKNLVEMEVVRTKKIEMTTHLYAEESVEV